MDSDWDIGENDDKINSENKNFNSKALRVGSCISSDSVLSFFFFYIISLSGLFIKKFNSQLSDSISIICITEFNNNIVYIIDCISLKTRWLSFRLGLNEL